MAVAWSKRTVLRAGYGAVIAVLVLSTVEAYRIQVSVSRQHLEIVAKPDGLYARDLGSANGTWLNGRQLRGEPARLEDGAEIQIGPDTKLNFRVS